MAMRLDGQFVLVAAALSSNPETAADSARDLGIEADRSYASYEEMARAEATRIDGIDVVVIVTPNHLHYAVARVFLDAGIHVICDKPLTSTREDARQLADAVRRSGKLFILTHNYTGYAMVRQAREMIGAGTLGAIRVVQAEYSQGWLATKLEDSDSKQAEWRTDPARAGAGGCIGDIGTHAYNLLTFVTGLTLERVSADLTTFVEGRRLDDNVHVLMRFEGGARGMLWASQVAIGCENGLRLRVFGERGGLEWHQEEPDLLWHSPLHGLRQRITRGGVGVGAAASRMTRVPSGHPEGYLEGFANVYAEAARAIRARMRSETVDDAVVYPTVIDGVAGLEFIEGSIRSSQDGSKWVDVRAL
jgi:predicted dehydrogenase